ncbi:anthranilate synthase component II [Ornithinibacillus xuwenensis]|uniref:Aminodeoxychorismate/anthranilate synthase component II n=1 Tax=Ornithinibacillus xuwenensis TaxID=3144668 RepID=A0ABU9XFL3_9BACI
MILLIDNYDSFTYNLYQYLGELGAKVIVKRNDDITVEDIASMNPNAIILSPGPGHPRDAGICVEVIQSFYQVIPILGICLGHQAIGAAFGIPIVQAKKIKHGKASQIKHNGSRLFEYMPVPLEVMRYHSLAIDKKNTSLQFEVTATSMDDGEIMAIQHLSYPLFGLQFHPESIGTPYGKKILKNFLAYTREETMNHATVSSEIS